MKLFYSTILIIVLSILLAGAQTHVFGAETQTSSNTNDSNFDTQYNQYEDAITDLSDPIEPFNRVMFQFNDKLYFYLLKPAAIGYAFILPEDARVSVSNFFANLATPVRLSNCLLQGRINDASNEFTRFCINSIYGVAGLFDPARTYWNISRKEEDFGQTLGRYGAGPGFYLVLPFWGPSTLRDGVGILVDFLPDPMTYLLTTLEYTGMEGANKVNYTSLHLGEYEQVKKEAIDPYLVVRDAYAQYRAGQISDNR